MDYHRDRFRDHSLLFRKNGRVIGVLPANEDGALLVSHGGLTYGGVVADNTMTTSTMLDVIEALVAHASSRGFAAVLYKRVPFIYWRQPADEDSYALFRIGASLVQRNIASTISLPDRLPYSAGRKSCVRKASRAGIVVEESRDFSAFMTMAEKNLRSRHGARPVHTAEELETLAERFPLQIRLFIGKRNGALVSGMVIYENGATAHAQYIASTDEGRELGAVDAVIDWAINNPYSQYRYFDLGTSVGNEGELNYGLIRNKESYGARAVAYDWYRIDI